MLSDLLRRTGLGLLFRRVPTQSATGCDDGISKSPASVSWFDAIRPTALVLPGEWSSVIACASGLAFSRLLTTSITLGAAWLSDLADLIIAAQAFESNSDSGTAAPCSGRADEPLDMDEHLLAVTPMEARTRSSSDCRMPISLCRETSEGTSSLDVPKASCAASHFPRSHFASCWVSAFSRAVSLLSSSLRSVAPNRALLEESPTLLALPLPVLRHGVRSVGTCSCAFGGVPYCTSFSSSVSWRFQNKTIRVDGS